MRIDRRSATLAHADRLDADIAQAARAEGVAGRVCGAACTLTCPQCGATTCQCSCSPDCANAGRMLSSEPAAFPVEAGVVPLVYALTKTGLFAPCWSCEGHLNPAGDLWKLPAVWFYCEATAHVRLLADGLTTLSHARRLNTPWRVAVTYSDPDNPRTTFTLEPALAPDRPVLLDALQADAREIARALPSMIAAGGQALQRAVGG